MLAKYLIIDFKYIQVQRTVVHYGSLNTQQKYDFMRTDLLDESSEKDLGVTFNAKLKFHDHIDQIILKVHKNCLSAYYNSLLLVRLLLVLLSWEATVVLRVYVALVPPHLEHCTQVWAPQAVHGHWSKLLQIELLRQFSDWQLEALLACLDFHTEKD